MRRYDWNSRLHHYLEQVVRQPFVWGHHDCTLFAAGAVLAMTGADHAADFRGRYATARGGKRVLRQAGHTDHVALAESLFAAVPLALAGEGDIAIVTSEEGPALGIFAGPGIYVVGPAGLSIVARDRATKALKVI
jgi:hypothetical protein